MTTITIDRALLEQALEALEYLKNTAICSADTEVADETVTALRAALAQEQAEPGQEPVAYIHRQGNHWEVSERHLDEDERDRGWTEEPLYTAPPKLVPLTEEEIRAAWDSVDMRHPRGTETRIAFARAVERALEEKIRGR